MKWNLQRKSQKKQNVKEKSAFGFMNTRVAGVGPASRRAFGADSITSFNEQSNFFSPDNDDKDRLHYGRGGEQKEDKGGDESESFSGEDDNEEDENEEDLEFINEEDRKQQE